MSLLHVYVLRYKMLINVCVYIYMSKIQTKQLILYALVVGCILFVIFDHNLYD